MKTRQLTEDIDEPVSDPGVHPAVDHRIEAGVRQGQLSSGFIKHFTTAIYSCSIIKNQFVKVLQHFTKVKISALKELCIYMGCTCLGSLSSLLITQLMAKEPSQVLYLRPVLALIPWVSLFIMLLMAKDPRQVQLIYLCSVLG